MDSPIGHRQVSDSESLARPQGLRVEHHQSRNVTASDRNGFLAALDKVDRQADVTSEQLEWDDVQAADEQCRAELFEDAAAERVAGSSDQSDDSSGQGCATASGLLPLVTGRAGDERPRMPEPVSPRLDSAALSGPIGPESLSALLRQSEAQLLPGRSMQFHVVGGDRGITSLQLSRDAGGWSLRLATDRQAREVLRRQANALEASLIQQGHSIAEIRFVEARTG